MLPTKSARHFGWVVLIDNGKNLWLAVRTEPEKLLYDGRQAVTFGFFLRPAPDKRR